MINAGSSATSMLADSRQCTSATTSYWPSIPSTTPASGAISKEELEAFQFATDEHGNRKMRDPEYQKQFQAMADKFYGTHEHQVIVGK